MQRGACKFLGTLIQSLQIVRCNTPFQNLVFSFLVITFKLVALSLNLDNTKSNSIWYSEMFICNKTMDDFDPCMIVVYIIFNVAASDTYNEIFKPYIVNFLKESFRNTCLFLSKVYTWKLSIIDINLINMYHI